MATQTVKGHLLARRETVRTLEWLARRWNVSKSEAFRRVIQASAAREPREAGREALRALDDLQRSLELTAGRRVGLERRLRAERRSASAPARVARPVILLDTSFLIARCRRAPPRTRRLREWLRADEELGMSAIAWAEFLCGPIEREQVDLAARVVPRRVRLRRGGRQRSPRGLFNDAGRRRGSLTDCMIAATALRIDALARHREPRRFPSLRGGRAAHRRNVKRAAGPQRR